jgi:hypothetical protein
MYKSNPHGRSRAWSAVDDKNGNVAGFTGVLPRKVLLAGKEITCWNCCDFSINKKYRTLGVALKLRRKAKECVDNGEIRALYAHPNDRMKVIHEKVGHFEIGKMNRYAKLMFVDQHMKKFIKNNLVRSLVNPVANYLLEISDISKKFIRKYPVELLGNDVFNFEYDELFQSASKGCTIIGNRGSEYLNWRYIQNPLYQTKRIAIRKNGKLSGYLIYLIEDGVAIFKDILCIPDRTIIKSLLTQWIELMRSERIESMSATLFDGNSILNYFTSMGFRIRPDNSSVFAYAKEEDDIRKTWINGDNWYMTVGDRDV